MELHALVFPKRNRSASKADASKMISATFFSSSTPTIALGLRILYLKGGWGLEVVT